LHLGNDNGKDTNRTLYQHHRQENIIISYYFVSMVTTKNGGYLVMWRWKG